MDDALESLLAGGRLAEAAALLEGRGQPMQAVELYERLWDHQAAARAALAGGDAARALANALRGGEPALVEQALQRVLGEPEPARLAAARTCEERGAWGHAGELYRGAGRPDRAVDCFDRGGLLLEAARCLGELGRTLEAVERYRRFLLQGERGTEGEGPVAAGARLALGLLLLRHGRYADALPLLQRAAAGEDDAVGLPAGRAVVAGLARLGYRHAALEALLALRERSGEGDLTVERCLQDPALAPMEDQPERVLAGRYRLGELLGAGGMGSVYQAKDLLSEQQVAVKIFTAPAGGRGREAFLRFVREARAMGQARHPHLVSLLDFNEEQGFMVLEYMEGGTLASRLSAPMQPGACRSMVLQLLGGLGAAHQRGIIHRDIKPSNIFYTGAGAVKLGDFGVAHLQDAGQTQTGAFIGTLAYMSPEQITGQPLTFACDIYALGVLLFRALTGRLPFNPPDLVRQHLHEPPPRPSGLLSSLPSRVDDMVLRCLAKRPEERFSSLDELRRAVEALPETVETARKSTPEAPEAPLAERRGGPGRFQVRGALTPAGPLQLHSAEDRHLGREVQLLRAAPGPHRARVLALARAAAAAGTEHLQRVLELEQERGQVILQLPPGQPAPPPADRRQALLLWAQLGQALAPLHAAGLAHGALLPRPGAPPALYRIGETHVLALAPALLAPDPGSHPRDVLAAAELAGLALPGDVQDGAALARWAEGELAK